MTQTNNKEEIEKDLQDILAINILSESEGGKLLIKGLKADIVSLVEIMVEKRNIFNLQEYTATACDIKSKLDVVKVLNKSKSNREFLEELLKE